MVGAMDIPETDSVDGTGASAAPEAGERIAKRLARAGLCSRRDAERWIAEGRVVVNGRTLDSPACVVRPGDELVVDGKPVPEPEPPRLWRYYKPSGLVTTARDEKGRDTVFSALPSDMPRVVSVGRLDLTTEGLLLLTNDGELARFLELPATGWTRRYRVRVHGMVNEKQLAALARGLTVEGVHYGPIEAVLDRVQGANAWLTVGIKEGKNREIRKVMESLGLVVNRLIRIAYGPFQLGKLEEGTVEEVPKRVLKDQLARFFAIQGGEDAEPAKAGPAKTGTAKAAPKPARRSAPKPAAPAAFARDEAPAPKGSRPARDRFGADRFGDDERPAPGGRKGPPRPASAGAAAPGGKPSRGGERGDRFGADRFGNDERPAPGGRKGPSRPASAGASAPGGKPSRGGERGDRFGADRFGNDERPAPGGRKGPSRPASAGASAPGGKPSRGGERGDRFGADRFGGDERPASGARKGPSRPASGAASAPAGKPARPARPAQSKSAPQTKAPAPAEAPRSQGNRASFSERLKLDRPDGGSPGGRPPRREGGSGTGGPRNAGPRNAGRADRRR